MAKNVCEKYGYLNRLSTEQLEELLRADFESDENSDVDVIFHVLEVIEEREKAHPTGRLPDIDMAWEEFQQYYNIPEGDGEQLYPYKQAQEEDHTIPYQVPLNGTHHIWRSILAASLAIAVFFGGMVAAQAAGIDVFGAIGQWTEDAFHFVSEDQSKAPADTRGITANPDSSKYYAIIRDTLESYGIQGDLAPTWFPSDVTMDEPEIFSNEFSDIILFPFTNEEGKDFCVDITAYQSVEDLNRSTFEKDSTPVEEYTSGSKTFYILSNIDTITATWASGTLAESIAGNLPIEELKSIIDSIGKG